jgi:hypothetical protein
MSFLFLLGKENKKEDIRSFKRGPKRQLSPPIKSPISKIEPHVGAAIQRCHFYPHQ